MIRYIVFIGFILLSAQQATAFSASEEAQSWFRELVAIDLIALQKEETSGRSKKDIDALNQLSFDRLKIYNPRRNEDRVDAVSYDFADDVLSSINRHPVVSDYNVDHYKNGAEIGFCFGRATYVHLALLRAGVQRSSIKKIWAVGPMQTGALDWQFHVATIVKADRGHWFVIDTFVGSVVTPEQWFKQMQDVSKDYTLRFYVSEPGKFSVSLGVYNRVQLGLDLTQDQDWYSHYFKDLMFWMSTEPLESVGLYDLR